MVGRPASPGDSLCSSAVLAGLKGCRELDVGSRLGGKGGGRLPFFSGRLLAPFSAMKITNPKVVTPYL